MSELLNNPEIPLSYQEKLKIIIEGETNIPRCKDCEFCIDKICYLNPPIPYPMKGINPLAGSDSIAVVSVRPSIQKPEIEFCSGFLLKQTMNESNSEEMEGLI